MNNFIMSLYLHILKYVPEHMIKKLKCSGSFTYMNINLVFALLL